MRIISGKYRGRKINPPANLPVRPTTDMAREALFSIINSRLDFENLRVLDLFCGAGTIAFEFISRGSPEVTAVDQNSRCLDFIRKTSEQFGMAGLRTMKADAFRFLEGSRRQWDIIFADPPYVMKESLLIPGMVRELKLLSADGLLIIEHPADISFSSEPGFFDQRHYSRVQFSFFNFSDQEETSTDEL